MDSSAERCCICAEETSAHFRNLMQLVTKYSGTLLYKLIERFLEMDLSGNAASLIASVVCQECVIKLNDYDAAQTKALIIQQEFTDLLRKNLVVVGETGKVKLGEEMYFKEEVDEASLDLTELEQIQEEEEDVKSVFSTEKAVSMKCNTCGDSFRSLNEMRTHSHKAALPEEEYDAELEFLDDPVEFNLDEIEYTNEERLEEEERSEAPLEEFAVGGDQKGSETELEYELIQEEEKPLPKIVLCRLAKCSECNVEFSSKAKLKEHIKEQHLVDLNQQVCDICGLMVRTKSALLSHKAKHSRTSKYDCTFCGKSFQQKGALTRHMPMHTGEKPYQCDKCGKQFIHYSSFHMHQLTHGNVRDKKCEICGYMLRSGSHLKRHMRVHSGEKPFECPTCGQKFAQRYNMMTHLKAHQGIYREYSKMYKCHFCDGTFQRKLKLQEHISRVHNTVIDSGLLKPVDRPRKQKKTAGGDVADVTDDDKQMIKFEQHEDEHFGGVDYVSC
uniref:Zinc finger protein with KRAB and SCAN domains 8 n=1 Tax=Culex pipiens TaxID=7175 RepID=A0A8D8CGE0_CULPI